MSGISSLRKLEDYYKPVAIEVKSKLVCSIFPGRLIFSEKKYRTPRVNEVFSLITKNINHLGIQKKQKAVKIDSLHHMASLKVQLSNSFFVDLKKLFELEPVLPVQYIDFNRYKPSQYVN